MNKHPTWRKEGSVPLCKSFKYIIVYQVIAYFKPKLIKKNKEQLTHIEFESIFWLIGIYLFLLLKWRPKIEDKGKWRYPKWLDLIFLHFGHTCCVFRRRKLEKVAREKQKCGVGVEEWENWVIFFKSRFVGHHQSSRGIHTLWRRLLGSWEGHTPHPTTPGHGLLRNTPGGCRSLSVKHMEGVWDGAYQCLLSFAAVLTLHASLPPSINPAHTILRVILPG